MRIEKIQNLAAGTWSRDCELLCLLDAKGFRLNYHKDEDDTYWCARCERVLAYKVTSEEFSTRGYLQALPTDGAFYEIFDSPWISEFGEKKDRIIDKCKHFVLQFYDETIEIIAQNLVFEQLSEKPDSISVKIK